MSHGCETFIVEHAPKGRCWFSELRFIWMKIELCCASSGGSCLAHRAEPADGSCSMGAPRVFNRFRKLGGRMDSLTGRPVLDSLSEGGSSAPAARLCLQRRAVPLQTK
jgi:hypothetical protein